MQTLAITIICLIVGSFVCFIIYGLMSVWLEEWGYSSKRGRISLTKFFGELVGRVFGILSFICAIVFVFSLVGLAIGSETPGLTPAFWSSLGGTIIFLALAFLAASLTDKED